MLDDLGKPMFGWQRDIWDAKYKKAEREIDKEDEMKPTSPSHPKNLYGSATAMVTNWDW